MEASMKTESASTASAAGSPERRPKPDARTTCTREATRRRPLAARVGRVGLFLTENPCQSSHTRGLNLARDLGLCQRGPRGSPSCGTLAPQLDWTNEAPGRAAPRRWRRRRGRCRCIEEAVRLAHKVQAGPRTPAGLQLKRGWRWVSWPNFWANLAHRVLTQSRRRPPARGRRR